MNERKNEQAHKRHAPTLLESGAHNEPMSSDSCISDALVISQTITLENR